MTAIAFYSITGQTEKFIKKTKLQAYMIDDGHPQHQMGEPYVLVVPSYQDFMMDSVVDFLTYKDNKKQLVGIIGAGNRSFNNLFGQTAKKIAATLKVPVLYLIEFSGTDTDVINVRQIMKNLSEGKPIDKMKKPKEMKDKIIFLSKFRDQK